MTLDSVTLLYTYISRFSVNPNYISSGKNSGKVSAINFIPNRSSLRFQLLSQMAHVRFHERKWVHTRLSEKDRTQRPTRRNTGLPDGGAIITLDTSCTFTNIPGPGIRKVYFAAFGPWPRVLPKNAESLRSSDALMRVAAPRRRGPAGLRDPVAIVSMIKNMINPWAGSFLTFCWANANSIKKVVLQPF